MLNGVNLVDNKCSNNHVGKHFVQKDKTVFPCCFLEVNYHERTGEARLEKSKAPPLQMLYSS